MNTYTDKNSFTEDAKFILENSDLLVKDNCVIHEGVLYEKLEGRDHYTYRFFMTCDDYDYLEDNDELEWTLDKLMSKEELRNIDWTDNDLHYQQLIKELDKLDELKESEPEAYIAVMRAAIDEMEDRIIDVSS